MRVLGIDPGLRNTGFGIIDINENKPSYVTSGIIATQSNENLPLRLKSILNGIRDIVNDNKPDIVSIEKVFFNVNPKSTLLLGQARGVCIAACVLHELEVFEYTALQVKQSVVGYGHASKEQVSKMVKCLLNLNGEPKKDAADALALAIAHTHYAKTCQIFNMFSVKKGRLID
ncbi:MAG TPA: crossover junction endodeoxyribonuclease RuvC [Burkholderiales bacterium]|nr:crossover junction endodeoxyribonuclease RuvC [Burkholderiales bacterium]